MLKNAVFHLKNVSFWVIIVTTITSSMIKLEASLDKIWNPRHELYNFTVALFFLGPELFDFILERSTNKHIIILDYIAPRISPSTLIDKKLLVVSIWTKKTDVSGPNFRCCVKFIECGLSIF